MCVTIANKLLFSLKTKYILNNKHCLLGIEKARIQILIAESLVSHRNGVMTTIKGKQV